MDMEEEVSEDLQDMEAHLTVDQDLENPMEAWEVHHTVDLDSEDQDMAHLQGMGQATDQDQDMDHHQDTDQGMDHLRREVDLEAQEDLYVVV